MKRRPWLTPFVVYVLWDGHAIVLAWRSCSAKEGGGICPDDNTCCPTSVHGISACITRPKHYFARTTSVCCFDDGMGETGCGPGYQCASADHNLYCSLRDNEKHRTPALPLTLPRYRLTPSNPSTLKQVHSLPVDTTNSSSPQLAYYFSTSSLDATDAASVAHRRSITTIVVVVHGSARNADDYLSCAMASIPTSQRESTMILAPWFCAPDDGPVNATDTSAPLLKWDVHHPIAHTWRYGANAIKSTISSYKAMDVLVERLNNASEFPLLERIVVAGHSAGGQFTHRWALTSGSPVWGDHNVVSSSSSSVPIRVVVMNPRSFAYLDGQRYVNGTLSMPDATAIDACPGYNSWEWGLAPGGPLVAPYKDRELKAVGGPKNMALRYSQRDVVYIAGEYDVLPVQSSCEDDDFQGTNRRQRSQLFFQALNELYPDHWHRRFVAQSATHDHCLMFQSSSYQHEVFENFVLDWGVRQQEFGG